MRSITGASDAADAAAASRTERQWLSEGDSAWLPSSNGDDGDGDGGKCLCVRKRWISYRVFQRKSAKQIQRLIKRERESESSCSCLPPHQGHTHTLADTHTLTRKSEREERRGFAVNFTGLAVSSLVLLTDSCVCVSE